MIDDRQTGYALMLENNSSLEVAMVDSLIFVLDLEEGYCQLEFRVVLADTG
jgi:hypothetical protein